MGTFLSLINFIVQFDIRHTVTLMHSTFIFVFFILSSIAAKIAPKKGFNNGAVLLYAAQIPIMTVGILMGTVWDKNNPAITFLMLMIAIPVFILDNAIWHCLVITGWMLLFLILDFSVKTNKIFMADLQHVLVFWLGAICINIFVLAERLDGVKDSVKSNFRAEHDVITRLKNRYALTKEEGKYLDVPIVVALISMDSFKFFNDMYGHNVGEEISKIFARDVSKIFDNANCYHYESNEVLVVLRNRDEKDFLMLLENVRNSFANFTIKGKNLHPSCSCGYVYGQARYEVDFHEMLRQADIWLLGAQNSGSGNTSGFKYENSRKKQTDILSEVGQIMNKGALDELTQLPNMQYFRVKGMEMLENTVNVGKKTVFVYLNIENFKGFNEEYGFMRGDELLRDIANIIREEFADRLISRFSEDHFVIMTYLDDVEDHLKHIVRDVSPYFHKVNMRIVAGIYEYEGGSIEAACDKAKMACDSVKREYKNNYRFYNLKMEDKNKLRQYVISHIDEAVQNEYLKVYYQPIVNVKTGKLIELEALARWKDPTHGLLSPVDFIPVLEESHLIYKVDEYVVEKVCKDYIKIRNGGEEGMPVSVNLSRLDFMLTDIVETVKNSLDAFKVPRNMINFEITESALAEDYDELMRRVEELKGLGFEVWLDDFGSGYSSFNTLQDFDFDVLKVDMRFMRTFGKNPQTPIILKSIIELVPELGMKSLVEGVETEEQFKFLQSIGTDYVQGYLFSEPIPIEELRRKFINDFPGHQDIDETSN